MKNIVIFGASGFTGHHVVRNALSAGFNVRAFVRDASRLAEDVRDKVEVTLGDVLNLDDVTCGITNQDGVVVALGTRNDLAPTTMMSDGLKNIINAMNKAGIKPLSVCLSAFLLFEPSKVPPMFLAVTEDHRRMSDALKSSSGIDWIAVYPPHIADTPATSDAKYNVSHETEPSTGVRGRQVSVRDLGHFLVHSLTQPEHYHKICGISS